ncbi:DUF357 domain-containing protein [Candidatus Woesearchaeota archaeon]|nr:DUF357 domain-containing protein [Candidatus Woesearchaeota archaeon]
MRQGTATTAVTDGRLARYFDITGRALAKAEPFPDADEEHHRQAREALDMARRYYDDAGHFREKGDLVTAFAALNYAHGWLDAAARFGLIDAGGDSELFVVDDDLQEEMRERHRRRRRTCPQP